MKSLAYGSWVRNIVFHSELIFQFRRHFVRTLARTWCTFRNSFNFAHLHYFSRQVLVCHSTFDLSEQENTTKNVNYDRFVTMWTLNFKRQIICRSCLECFLSNLYSADFGLEATKGTWRMFSQQWIGIRSLFFFRFVLYSGDHLDYCLLENLRNNKTT